MKRTMILMMLAALLASAFGGASVTPAFAEGESPDLVVTVEVYPPDLTKDPNYYVTDDITVELMVENNGDASAGAHRVLLCIDLPDEQTCDEENADYVANSAGIAHAGEGLNREIWSVTFNAGAFAIGDHTVDAVVDSNNEVDETCVYDLSPEPDLNCEDNNTDAYPFVVLAAPSSAPAHDEIGSAMEITLGGGGVTVIEDDVDVVSATRNEATDPSGISCEGGESEVEAGLKSLWYTFETEVDKSFVLSTYGSNYDTYIVVWDGDPNNGGNQVGCNEDYESILEGGSYSKLYIAFETGKTYYILIAQFTQDETNMELAALSYPGYRLTFTVSEAVEISGTASTAGAVLSYQEDSAEKQVTSAADGTYSVIIPSGWSGTITPFKTGLVFLPSQRTYSNVSADLTGENYTARQTYYSTGTQDGWILESGESTNKGGKLNKGAKALQVGDDALNRQYRSILSFNTSNLPDNAAVSKAILRVRRQGVTGGGNPITTFGGFMVDIKKGNFGTAGLQLADFSTKGNQTIGAFKPKLVGGWYTINLTKGKARINTMGNTQIRLRFKLDDNNNSVANFLKLYSGNAPLASRPQLIIEYSMPMP